MQEEKKPEVKKNKGKKVEPKNDIFIDAVVTKRDTLIMPKGYKELFVDEEVFFHNPKLEDLGVVAGETIFVPDPEQKIGSKEEVKPVKKFKDGIFECEGGYRIVVGESQLVFEGVHAFSDALNEYKLQKRV